MSSYLVDKNHIEYLVQAGKRFRVELWDWDSDLVASELWKANVASVRHMYPTGPLPGPSDADLDRFTRPRVFFPLNWWRY